MEAILPDCEIYLLSILSVVEAVGNSEEDTKEVNAFYETISKSYDQVQYIDLYNQFMINGKPNEYFFSADGVHLNGEGYQVWLDAIKKYI